MQDDEPLAAAGRETIPRLAVDQLAAGPQVKAARALRQFVEGRPGLAEPAEGGSLATMRRRSAP